MIQLYHGEDVYKSRQQLAKALEKYSQVDYLDKKEVSLEKLVQYSGGLFSTSNQKALVLENLLSLPKKRLAEIFEQLDKLNADLDFFIWQNKKLTKSKTNLVNKYQGKVKHFKLPNNLFKFLDQLGQGNIKFSLKYLNQTLSTHPPELLLFFMLRRAKKMYLAKKDAQLLKMPGWQKRKLLTQTQNIELEKIEAFYLNLIKTDWYNKTGQLGCSLENKLINLILDLDNK